MKHLFYSFFARGGKPNMVEKLDMVANKMISNNFKQIVNFSTYVPFCDAFGPF